VSISIRAAENYPARIAIPSFNLRRRFALSPPLFAFIVSAYLCLTANFTFWQQSAQALWAWQPSVVLLFVSLACVLIVLPMVLLLLLPGQHAPRLGASVLVVLAAIAGHFMDSYGSPMTANMMRNVLQTDPAEVADLINAKLLLRFVLLGVMPVIFIWRTDLTVLTWGRALRSRLQWIVGALVAAGLTVYLSSPLYAVFLREHKLLRSYINPGAVMVNTVTALRADARDRGPLVDPADPAQVLTASTRPRLLVLVVGETARAANFQLGGYARATNPQLASVPELIYFGDVSSCGTSTADSVPCMFSHLGREGARRDSPGRYLNLLDLVQRAGVQVQWWDNNSGCKGVCDRVPSDLLNKSVPAANEALCPGASCYDELLTRRLRDSLEKITSDSLLVMHPMGSHGPAYSERYPPEFASSNPPAS
jgi:lipid A ethanolaminephosphotransferase